MTSQNANFLFRPRLALVAGAASIITVAVLIVIKAAAYLSTGSASVLASLTDSITDAAVSVMSFWAIHHSLKPADADHRHGHGKVEGLAALLQGALIAGAAFFLALESLQRLADPQPVTQFGIAIVVMAVSTLLSILLVAVQNYSLNHAPSLAVESDKAHYASDILMNAGVIAALALQYYGAPDWVDGLCAFGVSAWLFRAAYGVGLKGVNMLLDRELPDETRNRILAMIRAHPAIHGVHDLRTRAMGMQIEISFDIEVDRTLTLEKAHDIARETEAGLLSEFPHAEIMIHIDPEGEIGDSRHTAIGVQQ